MNKMHALSAALLAAFSGTVLAGGFQSMEQNASGLGTGYAGSAAVADNASTIFYNPAGMTRLPARQVSLGLVGALHNYEFNNEGSIGTGGDGGDAGEWRALPNAYLSWALSPEWVVGLGISSPFSLHTDYDDNWLGRFQSVEAEVRTLNVNPSVAYKLSEKVSLGLGLNYQKIKVDTALNNGVGALVRTSTDDSAWGWNAGVLFTLSPAMRIGVAYRSAIKYDLDEPVNLTGSPAAVASRNLDLPGTFTLSVWQQVSDRWEAMGDLSYTHWKVNDDFERDSWRFAWGAAYKYNETWKSRFGISYDRSPLRDGERNAQLPDGHRIGFSIGGQYKPSQNSALDFGYTYQWMKNTRIDQAQAAVPVTRLKGEYDAGGHLLGVQYTQSF
ncbi:MAG: outer membrane protein transport protein [Azovibrio sp.]|uniref:OmpP1/FadL family transporter n=1 Tax=Azovibrio sp. TaxID=1872673 RepID=UPI003C70BC6E